MQLTLFLISLQQQLIFPTRPYGSSQNATVSDGFLGIGSDSRTIEDVDQEIAELEEQMEANADAQTCAGGEDGELDERRSEMIDEMGELKDLKKIEVLRSGVPWKYN